MVRSTRGKMLCEYPRGTTRRPGRRRQRLDGLVVRQVAVALPIEVEAIVAAGLLILGIQHKAVVLGPQPHHAAERMLGHKFLRLLRDHVLELANLGRLVERRGWGRLRHVLPEEALRADLVVAVVGRRGRAGGSVPAAPVPVCNAAAVRRGRTGPASQPRWRPRRGVRTSDSWSHLENRGWPRARQGPFFPGFSAAGFIVARPAGPVQPRPTALVLLRTIGSRK